MPNPVLEYWYLALGQQVGIIILTSDVKRLMNQLYTARSEARDEDLMKLSICTSPTSPDELWIIHKTIKVKHAEGNGAAAEASGQPV